jgi:hypothetical protein
MKSSKNGTSPTKRTKVGLPSQILGENHNLESFFPTMYENPDVASYNSQVKSMNVKNPVANHLLTAQDPKSRFAGSNSKEIREETKKTIRGIPVW